MTTPKIYEFYFPKTKSKHIAKPVKGKVYPSKGGTVRYGIQATMNGSMSLPKYIKEDEFNRLGFGAETYDAEIEGNVEYERMEERTVDVRQEIEQPFSVQTDPAEYEHEYPEDIENAIKHGIHNQLYDNPNSKLAKEGGFIENIETDIEVVDLEDDPDSEPRELTAYGNLGKPEINDEEEYYRQAKITDIEKEFRNEEVKSDLDYIREFTDSFMSKNPTVIGEYGPYGYYKLYEHPVRGQSDYLYFYTPVMGGLVVQSALHHKDQMNDEDAPIVSNNLVKLLKQDNLYHTDSFGDEDQLNIDALYEGTENVYFAESFEATSGSGQISHNPIDVVKQRPAIMRHDYAFTHYDWNTGNYDLTDEQEDELNERIREEITSEPSEGHMDIEIDDVAEDDDGDFITANVDAYTNYGEGRFYGFDAESKMNNCPVCKGDTHADMSMIGEETVADICGDCDIYIMPQENDYPRVSCIECGFGDPYGSATTCMNCDAIKNEMEFINMGAETVGNPSPSSPLEETPATVPSPAEPTNETFESQNSNMKLALGLTGVGIGLAFWKGKEIISLWDSIISRLKK